ncbi:MAG: hypothetical protein J3R72DRAFT_472439 [Linnemannia gamsii]|nr:MAG: hypothetical protein J3R72DRAFT_472439 [Linnemannia gamsii]
MSSEDKPTVLIVGAGLGGLMLAALLEKSGVPFSVFERATIVKPLGSAMSIGPTLLPIFQQLGIYDELLTIGKYITHSYGFNEESLQPTRPLDLTPGEEYTGYGQYIIARPKLYDLILQLVPAHKIHFGHRVLDITEDDDKVTVHLSSRDKFEGDIIVGADGAYSAVRQRMYEQLKAKGKLPKADQEDLPFSCTCLVGQTDILDPEKFPLVALPRSHYNSILGKDKPFSWHTFNTAEGKLCFMMLHHLDSKASKAAAEQRFRSTNNAEWGAHPAQAMCDETRDFPLPLGGGKTGTLGDLYDSTPKELISKVMLKEKVFETWYHRRFVLLGDACHKLNPAGGHGAVTAMHDAIALANLLYAMPTKTSSDITKIFDEYHKERLPAVMESFNSSQQLSNIFKAGLVGAIYCFLATHMPMWVWRIVMAQTVRYRPQVGFMKRIELKGTIAPVFSPSEQKARDVFENQPQSNNVLAV